MKTPRSLYMAFTGIAFSVGSRIYLNVGDSAFVTLIGFSILAGFVIHFQKRINSVDLSKMKIHLDKVADMEASVKDVAGAIVDVIEANDHAIMLNSYDENKAKRAMTQLKRLIDKN